jgi:uncharacterized protein (DUF305 family)
MMSGFAMKGLLALSLVACTSTRTTNPTPTPAPTEAAAPTPAAEPSHTEHATAEADLMFIDMMIPHHQQAMQMAEMAQTRAQRPEVKEMASKMQADQKREVEKMKEWRSGWYADAPQAAMHDMHDMHDMSGTQGMQPMDMSGLQAAQGEQFDRMFVDMMIPHHEQALQMADQMRGKVVHAELGQLIEEMSATQQAEIATMRSWQESWAKSPSN